MRQETEVHFLVGTVILGFVPILKKSQESSLYEALISMCLSRVQMDVRPPVQMRQIPTAFSRVSAGDADMPSSCEMKDEPEFKPLQESLLLSQGLSGSIPLETENTEFHSHLYC